MALENMKSRFGNIIKDWDEFNVYGRVAVTNTRIPSKKPISNIVQSGGYTPGGNYGDDIDIDEV